MAPITPGFTRSGLSGHASECSKTLEIIQWKQLGGWPPRAYHGFRISASFIVGGSSKEENPVTGGWGT